MKKFIAHLFLFLSLCIASSHLLYAQNMAFSNLTTEDGLSQFSVNSLYIDENGILWIGTREGLNRYNGKDIQTYKLEKDNPYSLFSNTVIRITGDRKGKIFLLCNDGVAQLDLRTQKFKTLLVDNIKSIYYNKGLYIAYERPHKVDFTEKTLRAALEWCLVNGPFEYVCCVDSGKSYRMKVEEMTPDEVKAFRENRR